jgi:molybdopterin-containing oxidoreductase family membrane subunit
MAHSRINNDLLRPLFQTTWRFYLLVGLFGTVVLIGARRVAIAGVLRFRHHRHQVADLLGLLRHQLRLLDRHQPRRHAHLGNPASGRCRLAPPGDPLRRGHHVFALMIGAMFPIIHLGRPWLAFWLFPYPSERLIWPNFRSPLVWDFFAINTYLTGSVLFLFLPMIPDFAVVRDKATGLRKKIYGVLALGWRGTPKQWNRLESAMSIMAVAIVPVAVSVPHHRLVRLLDGTGADVADDDLRPVLRGRRDLQRHRRLCSSRWPCCAASCTCRNTCCRFTFQNLGKLLLVMALLWGYFVFNERLVTYYGNEPSEMAVFWRTQRESFAPLYWTMVIGNFVLPVVLMGIKYFRTITGCVIASVGVIVGMWLERFLIIVPSLGHKYLPYSFATYSPQPVEIIIAVATFAAMTLLYVLFAKFVPIISIWELKAGDPTDRFGHSHSAAVRPVLMDRPRD